VKEDISASVLLYAGSGGYWASVTWFRKRVIIWVTVAGYLVIQPLHITET
jgi:hypothetical protein